MFRFVLRFVLIVLASLISQSAFTAEDPWLMLQKAALAARELNYQGVFIYHNGTQTRSVQITHMNNAGQELTRNVVMEGLHREVFSQGSDIVIFQPKDKKMLIEKRRGQNLFPALLPSNLQTLKSNYSVKLGVTDFIAGRPAQIIELIPNDVYRYSYKIWTDNEFGLLVKMSLNDDKKQTLEQVTFSELSMLNSQDKNWFQPKIDVTKSYVVEDATLVNHTNSNWVVTALPPGFTKVDEIERVVPGKKAPVNQMIFSDGIASVSLFIEPVSKTTAPRMGHTVIGSTNICAHVMDGYQIMVVGEVPAATVQQISKSVSFKKETAQINNK
jgi:sigma-E factor negative regulatory protein RseB